MNQRGQLIPKGDNKWLVRVYLGRDENGKRKYISKQISGTVSQAKAELTKLQHDADRGTVVVKSGKTVTQLIADYLASKASIEQRTRDQYQWNLERYVVPEIGFLKIDKVSRETVQKLYNDMLKKGLSPRTIKYVHACLRAAFEYALLSGFLVRNPCDHTERPKVAKRPPSVLAGEQCVAILDHAEKVNGGEEDSALWSVLLLGGLRPQEACALRWSDLVFADGLVSAQIVRAVEWHLGKADVKETKTSSSRRTVIMPERVAKALTRHRSAQARRMMEAGPKFQRLDLVFTTSTGTLQDISCIRKRWATLLVALGLPKVRLYDTRHTHATLLLGANEHPKVVQERLGHSSITLTMDTYSHVTPTMQLGAVTKLDTVLKSAAIAGK